MDPYSVEITATETITYLMASIMEGEGGILGYQGMLAVGFVALNRVEAGMGPLGHGWYGREDPSSMTYSLAEFVLNNPTEDPTGGALYALSNDDVHTLGFPRSDLSIRGPTGHAVNLYWRWHE